LPLGRAQAIDEQTARCDQLALGEPGERGLDCEYLLIDIRPVQGGELLGHGVHVLLAEVAAVLVSGIVALTLSPMLASRILSAQPPGRFERGVEHFFGWLAERYRRMLANNLRYWPAFVGFALLVMLSMFPMYVTSQHELAPNEDQGILFVAARGPETATIDYTQRHTRDVLKVYEEIPEFYESFFILGFGGSPNTAFSGFKIVPMAERERSQQEVQDGLLQAPLLALQPSLPGPAMHM
jgi:multidrug efflux pump subunit AcrB